MNSLLSFERFKIRVSGLSKSFSDPVKPKQRKLIFEDVDMEIGVGFFSALMGPSGCGKSTLLKIIAGLETADTGSVDYYLAGKWIPIIKNGQFVQSDSTASQLRCKHIGFVFQSHQLIHEFNVLENVALPLQLQEISGKEARERAAAMLDRVGLGKELAKFPETLSVGMQQRVGIARAMVHEPTLIFADEPTASLDPGMAEEVIEMMLLLQEFMETTILMITHSPQMAKPLDEIWQFVRSQGNVDEISYSLERKSSSV